jgi:hypothetical protein
MRPLPEWPICNGCVIFYHYAQYFFSIQSVPSFWTAWLFVARIVSCVSESSYHEKFVSIKASVAT